MSSLPYLPPSISEHLAGYPPWLVIAVGLVVVLAALWILGKLIKWALSLLLIVLAIGSCALIVWLIWQAIYGVPGGPHGP